jgi:hypothetical protein
MTTDELERDLQTLADPRPEDAKLRLALRATLSEHLQARPRRPRRTRLALGSVALTTAALAAAIVAVIGTGGPPSADAAILAHVSRTMSPPANLIIHVKENGALSDGTPVVAEWWQATNPPYAMRLIKGQGDRLGEGAIDGTTSFQYDPTTNTIYQQSDSNPPRLVDPIESVRAGLANGTAQVDGTVTIDGRSLYKIEMPDGVVGYFDQRDYRPEYLDNPQRGGDVVRTKVTAYEELPLTSENETLLSITAQHPRATVETGPVPASANKTAERK